ncbi:MAG: malate synthase A, partial [Gammaproteobacteria bacterium]|nr:malate synthase A [Gammaproteobacteria bacterium]
MKTATRSAPQTGLALAIRAPALPGAAGVLGETALGLLAHLHERFEPRRRELLARRVDRQAALDAGELPGFLAETAAIRSADWRVAPVPADLQDRRVEITGPVDRKMMINALNSPARAFMADFEDSCAPTWENIVNGQINLRDAVDRSIAFEDPASGRSYRLNERTATLIVRPRGWHLPE